MEKTFLINGKEISSIIEFKKTKYLKLRVRQNIIKITVPFKTSLERINKFVYDNQNYIIKHLLIEQKKIEKETFYNHQLIKIFDRDYELIFSNKTIVLNNYIYINTISKVNIKDQIVSLFKDDLLIYFKELTLQCYRRLNTKIPCPNIVLRKMKNTLGNYCKSLNLIKYSTNMLFKPLETYEALVCHELSHIIEQNHSIRFYNVLHSICPNYKQLSKIMKER